MKTLNNLFSAIIFTILLSVTMNYADAKGIPGAWVETAVAPAGDLYTQAWDKASLADTANSKVIHWRDTSPYNTSVSGGFFTVAPPVGKNYPADLGPLVIPFCITTSRAEAGYLQCEDHSHMVKVGMIKGNPNVLVFHSAYSPLFITNSAGVIDGYSSIEEFVWEKYIDPSKIYGGPRTENAGTEYWKGIASMLPSVSEKFYEMFNQ